jgi:hypothetical protein
LETRIRKKAESERSLPLFVGKRSHPFCVNGKIYIKAVALIPLKLCLDFSQSLCYTYIGQDKNKGIHGKSGSPSGLSFFFI